MPNKAPALSPDEVDALLADAAPGHTPGPWELIPLRSMRGYALQEAARPRRTVAYLRESESAGLVIANHEANAHLIAAAPEMLAALKEIVFLRDNRCPGTPWENRMRDAVSVALAAIAKAEGRS